MPSKDILLGSSSVQLGQSKELALSEGDFFAELNKFTIFLGYREIANRLERVAQKYGGYYRKSDIFRRKFAFANTLRRIYVRRRLSRPVNFRDPEEYTAASTIASCNVVTATLSRHAKERFRAALLEALKPDRDFRAIQHELRVFTHFRQLGCSVIWADLEQLGNFDFLVTSTQGQFEVECKTVSEDMESPIQSELSVAYFDKIESVCRQPGALLVSGIVTFRMKGPPIKPLELEAVLREFLCRPNLPPLETPSALLTFDAMPEWMTLFHPGKEVELFTHMAAARDKDNPLSLIVATTERVTLFNVVGSKKPRLVRRIAEVAKDACKQLSGARPSAVWLHFLGLSEPDFRRLAQRSMHDARTAFNAIAGNVFSSVGRDHVNRLLFSADGRKINVSDCQSEAGTQLSIDGPAYEARNWQARYPLDVVF